MELQHCHSNVALWNVTTLQRFRELFSDALERDGNFEKADHPYDDGFDQGDDDHVNPWEDHPYYDYLGISGADQVDDELDTPGHEDLPDVASYVT